MPDDYRKQDGSRYLSGVEWEYEDAYTASPRPEILVYRRSQVQSVGLDDPNLEEKFRQYQAIKQFFARFLAPDGSLQGGFNTYETPSEFKEKFADHLRSLVLRRIEEVERIRETALRSIRNEADPKSRRSVFISYSHADADWLERLKIHLKPLEREGGIEYWDDTKIRPGSHWREEIKLAIVKARVAVLLISADFLASEFISTNELPPLLLAAEEEGAVILPLLISPSRFTKMPGLSRFQSVNPPTEPLIALSRAQSEAMLVRLTDVIEDAMI